MLAAQVSPRQRVFRDNGLFGATKNHPHLARLVSHRALSYGNHFALFAVKETGPNLFGKVQFGKEELDDTFFQLSLEEFYPNYPYENESGNYNKC